MVGVLALARPAYADVTGTGQAGQRLSISASELPEEGGTITVKGSGYDESKGIYLAFCVRPKPGELPTPCGGGADLTGATDSSKWISSTPPRYGEGLATPYGPGGTFETTLTINPRIGGSPVFDCREIECVVVTRADHTRSADRTQDVLIPVTFGGGPPIALVAAAGGGVVVLAAAGVLLLRRRGARR
ncbi:hypothetical protein [Acrocarpospora catenulata]|uniref:hypothetical protein n=1 Tax=Acrocarpospora catenulata TaxID=2836182 RepID=UPI001BDA8AE5|nr:hypothetical protein [Acrocarpospora catenulata]